MGSSRRNTFASAAAVLLLVVMATEMMPVQADDKYCYFLSRNFKGWCSKSSSCESVCLDEAPYNNTGGQCRGWFPARCWCNRALHTATTA
uniref:Knottins-like domain-containing protein n=1 Tax=Setaria viridis TaxID=4556 RepID=A0A4U6VAW6_SETVI|nr:hypothetical protein SEVIR_3G191700v2 [Setaria viridis]